MADNEYDKRDIQIRTDKGLYLHGQIQYCDFIRDDEDWCHVCLYINERLYESTEKHFFTALLRIREQLEKEKFQILCNGAARNVYPSAMMFDMGSAGIGYKMTMNKPTTMSDVVDIFEYDESLEFVTVSEQEQFLVDWQNCEKRR